MWWAVLTPTLQWLAYFSGRKLLRRLASQPENRRTAVVVGASALGVKVSRAFQAQGDAGLLFVGYFDDRADDRVDPEATGLRLGSLRQVAPFIREHAVQEVYITLPLGSQPRIVELMEQVQGTTASVFFVPDVFGISIIQGRLTDMNGVPVVGLCETPFTGTNRLVKRLSDLVLSSLILILLVLLHKGRGGGLSDMFGGGMSSSSGGSSVAERNLDRITVGLGGIWIACIIGLGLLLKTGV